MNVLYFRFLLFIIQHMNHYYFKSFFISLPISEFEIVERRRRKKEDGITSALICIFYSCSCKSFNIMQILFKFLFCCLKITNERIIMLILDMKGFWLLGRYILFTFFLLCTLFFLLLATRHKGIELVTESPSHDSLMVSHWVIFPFYITAIRFAYSYECQLLSRQYRLRMSVY